MSLAGQWRGVSQGIERSSCRGRMGTSSLIGTTGSGSRALVLSDQAG
jgi:hypothetical protein